MSNKKKNRIPEEEPECTISQTLFKQWQRCQRRSDVKDMSIAFGRSHVAIYKALKYGYVKLPELTGQITKFFSDRLDQEAADAEALSDKLSIIENKKNEHTN